MTTRKLLVEDMQQIEQALCEMERPVFTTVRCEESFWANEAPRYIKALYRAMHHILEYLVRKAKADE